MNPNSENLDQLKRDFSETKRTFEEKLDEFLQSDAAMRPLTLADMMFALSAIKEMFTCAVGDIAQIAQLSIDRESYKLEHFNPADPMDYIEHDSVCRKTLFELYFAHQCSRISPSADVYKAQNAYADAQARLVKAKKEQKENRRSDPKTVA